MLEFGFTRVGFGVCVGTGFGANTEINEVVLLKYWGAESLLQPKTKFRIPGKMPLSIIR